jgi:zinc-ribbon domain
MLGNDSPRQRVPQGRHGLVHPRQRPLRDVRSSLGRQPGQEAPADGDRGSTAELRQIAAAVSLKPGSGSTDVLGMAQTDVEIQSLGEVAPSPGRFACPSCGSMLRTGAILCPGCGADLWTMAHGGPAPSPQVDPAVAEDARIPASSPADRRRARSSLLIAAVALGAKLVVQLVSAGGEPPASPWFVVGWATTLLAVYAVFLGRRVTGRLEGERDERSLTMARYGLILGMASLAYVASAFITSSIDQAIR